MWYVYRGRGDTLVAVVLTSATLKAVLSLYRGEDMRAYPATPGKPWDHTVND